MTEVHDLLLEIRRLKFWLILVSLLWAVTLGFNIASSHSIKILESKVAWQIDKTAQIKAAYEEQKKDLYALDQRFTEAEVKRRVRLALKEKEDG